MAGDRPDGPGHSGASSSSTWRRGLGLAVIGLAAAVLGLGFFELGLRVALNPADFLTVELRDDPVLRHRIAPGDAGHDAMGLRNARVPAQVPVVALGDSQTYGVGVPSPHSWPAQLQQRLGEPVYNMGLGGWGPLQYLAMARTQAVPLRAREWVVGLYLGNDLVDAHLLPIDREHWASWRRPEGMAAASGTAVTDPATEPPKRFGALRDLLARRSLLYAVLRASVWPRLASAESPAGAAATAPDQAWAWQDPAHPAVRTVFTPQQRHDAMDLGQPRVADGLVQTLRALAGLQAAAAEAGVRLTVMVVPTKEGVYCPRLIATAAPMPAAHQRLCAHEARLGRALRLGAAELGVSLLDPTPALQAAAQQGLPMYPPSRDGHPVAAGYAILADALARHLKEPRAGR